MGEFVVVGDSRIKVKDKKLNLQRKGIANINEIKGLESLTDLEELDLSWNRIEYFQEINSQSFHLIFLI